MAEETLIAWTDHTFNGWLGCTKVSAGCTHCYAETLATNRMGLKVWGPTASRKITTTPWQNARMWNRAAARAGVRRRVFCGSMMDWAEDHPVANRTRPAVWELVRECSWLDWQMLTKRPQRIRECLPKDWGSDGSAGYHNVWLGTSVEDMRVADRVDHLRDIPAVVRFISYEPALGPLDDLDLTGIDWVIVGGESGSGFRPMDVAWARSMRQKCAAAEVAFFFKQSAAIRTEMGIELDGQIVREYPTPREARRAGSLF